VANRGGNNPVTQLSWATDFDGTTTGPSNAGWGAPTTFCSGTKCFNYLRHVITDCEDDTLNGYPSYANINPGDPNAYRSAAEEGTGSGRSRMEGAYSVSVLGSQPHAKSLIKVGGTCRVSCKYGYVFSLHSENKTSGEAVQYGYEGTAFTTLGYNAQPAIDDPSNKYSRGKRMMCGNDLRWRDWRPEYGDPTKSSEVFNNAEDTLEFPLCTPQECEPLEKTAHMEYLWKFNNPTGIRRGSPYSRTSVDCTSLHNGLGCTQGTDAPHTWGVNNHPEVMKAGVFLDVL
jgi:hypothetical protein